MVIVSSCPQLATSIIVVRTIQVSLATIGQVRSARAIRVVRCVCALIPLIPVKWVLITTAVATGGPCGQSVRRIYYLPLTDNK